MMMFAPEFLLRQNEGAKGKEQEESGGQRKSGSTGTPTPVSSSIMPARSNTHNNNKDWKFVVMLRRWDV